MEPVLKNAALETLCGSLSWKRGQFLNRIDEAGDRMREIRAVLEEAEELRKECAELRAAINTLEGN